jgi:ABC1 atypical kinase-like domain
MLIYFMCCGPRAARMQARELMAQAWGRPPVEVFTSLSAEPVAAASLGQVYRGRLVPELGGLEVAVKVQRPRVRDSVALDLYLMRTAAVALQVFPEVITACLFRHMLCCLVSSVLSCSLSLVLSCHVVLCRLSLDAELFSVALLQLCNFALLLGLPAR